MVTKDEEIRQIVENYHNDPEGFVKSLFGSPTNRDRKIVRVSGLVPSGSKGAFTSPESIEEIGEDDRGDLFVVDGENGHYVIPDPKSFKLMWLPTRYFDKEEVRSFSRNPILGEYEYLGKFEFQLVRPAIVIPAGTFEGSWRKYEPSEKGLIHYKIL